MPLGDGLKVTTMVGETSYQDEEHRQQFYTRNQQAEGRKQAGADYAKPFGHADPRKQDEDFEMPADMQKAINNDLAEKGVGTKPRRPRNKKTTPNTTNDAN